MSTMIKKNLTTDTNKCNNKLNSTLNMLTILNVSEESEKYEILRVEDDMIQEQAAKNTRNFHPIFSTLSI